MRGEHPWIYANPWRFQGSSPHARGTLAHVVGGGGTRGIIPACAGNTSGRYRSSTSTWDHPRMRGEHPVSQRGRHHRQGSSPHARGTRRAVRCHFQPGGIIPACAGNTTASPRSTTRTRDHPRMRGEHDGGEVLPALDSGSSPHARGTLR